MRYDDNGSWAPISNNISPYSVHVGDHVKIDVSWILSSYSFLNNPTPWINVYSYGSQTYDVGVPNWPIDFDWNNVRRTLMGNVTLTQPLVTPVPEPETWALMLAGLAGCLFRSKRRQSAQAGPA